MANRVYTQEDIVLNNEESDITVTLRPLPIARLREFMEEWKKLEVLDKEKGDEVTEEEIFSVYTRCCGVALRKQLAEKVDGKVYDDKHEFTTEYIDLLEDYLELPSIVKILDICGGVRLENPKLQADLAALLAETDEPEVDGTN